MKDPTHPFAAGNATTALAFTGDPGLPYLIEALSDTNQWNRPLIVSVISMMPHFGVSTSACLAPLLKATTDSDRRVRSFATNAVRRLAPNLLTNAPSQ